MTFNAAARRNPEGTVFVGGLDDDVTEELLWELFEQIGPVADVYMPKHYLTHRHQGYGFVEYLSEGNAHFAVRTMHMRHLYGKPMRLNKVSARRNNLDIGANIFVGNLDVEVDEKLLYDTFSAFGDILKITKIVRVDGIGNSRGYAFINFASFYASDAAIHAMKGQYLYNKPLAVSYAYNKNANTNRRSSNAERLLAAVNAALARANGPHQLLTGESVLYLQPTNMRISENPMMAILIPPSLLLPSTMQPAPASLPSTMQPAPASLPSTMQPAPASLSPTPLLMELELMIQLPIRQQQPSGWNIDIEVEIPNFQTSRISLPATRPTPTQQSNHCHHRRNLPNVHHNRRRRRHRHRHSV